MSTLFIGFTIILATISIVNLVVGGAFDSKILIALGVIFLILAGISLAIGALFELRFFEIINEILLTT